MCQDAPASSQAATDAAATPSQRQAAATAVSLPQAYMVIELGQKMDVIWSFIKTHLKAKTIIFLSTCKQVGRKATSRACQVTLIRSASELLSRRATKSRPP
jgi:hypothetical protein